MIDTTQQIHLRTHIKKQLADMVTPVSVFLKVRDHYTQPVMLESNDFSSAEDCFSYIGLQAIAEIQVKNGLISTMLPDGETSSIPVIDVNTVPDALQHFAQQFSVEQDTPYPVYNGLFGHVGFDGVQYFDTLKFDSSKRKFDIPDIRFTLHRFIIAINHYKNELYLLENLMPDQPSEMDKLEALLRSQKVSTHEFHLEGKEESNLSDD